MADQVCAHERALVVELVGVVAEHQGETLAAAEALEVGAVRLVQKPPLEMRRHAI